MAELDRAGILRGQALTVTGKTASENCSDKASLAPDVIRSLGNPVREAAGFIVLSGNLFRSAVMKVSAISADFSARYLSNRDDPLAFVARAIVFDGPEDYHARIEDPALQIDGDCILIMRGAGPIGYPGSAEVVNMQAPAYLLAKGINELPTMGDGRQSGTSGAPSILNVSPEAAAGGGLAILRTGDRIRIDLGKRQVDVLLDEEEIADRVAAQSYAVPDNQTFWQQLYRQNVNSLEEGATFPAMTEYTAISSKTPRHSH
jgi:dihydroxy-acid dehydratase